MLISYTFIFCLVAQPVFARKATSTVRQAQGAIHPAFEQMEFSGKPYQYYERHSPDGRLIGQYLLGKDRTEIMLDNNGDGRLDSWEIFTPGGKILMSAPHVGKFLRMDVEVRTKKGIVQYGYYWNRKAKLYTLFSMKARPYEKFGFTNQFIIGCLGSESGVALETLSEQLNAQLNSSSDLSVFKQNISSQAMDSSCTTGEFKAVAPMIADGIAAIATSEKDGNWTAAGQSASPVQRGMYLQCMRHYGLFAQAARIESAFAQYTSLVPSNKFLWGISCGNKSATDLGTFLEGEASTPPRIEMHATATEMKQYLNKPNATQAEMTQGYARVFFHEMLHYSMMGENDTHMVEDCCAEPVEGPAKEAKCAYVASATARALNSQGLQNELIDTFSKSGQDYGAFQDDLARAYPGTSGVDGLHLTLNSLGEIYSKYSKMPECTSSGTSENPFGKCADQYKAEAEKVIKSAYGPQDGSDCRNKVDAQYGADGAKAFCAQTQGIIETLLGKAPVACAKAKTSASTDVFSIFTYVAALLSSTPVNAQADAYTGNMCSISSGLKVDADYGLDNYAPANPDNPALQMPLAVNGSAANPSNSGANDALSHSGSGSSATSSTGTGTRSPSSSKTSYDVGLGPSRPYFSNDSSPRANEIINHIKNSDGLIQNVQRVAEKSFDSLIPSAQAEPSTVKTVYKGSNYDGSTVANVPRVSVPDPIGNLGANGGASQPLPSRAPASIPSAGSLPVTPVASQVVPGVGGLQGGVHGGVHGFASDSPAGSNHLGAANRVGGLSPAEAKAKLAANVAEERAKKSLLLYLKNKDYFNKVKPELARPSVEASLLDHKVQVVDDEGKVHGSGFPSVKLIFDVNKNYLVDAPLGGR